MNGIRSLTLSLLFALPAAAQTAQQAPAAQQVQPDSLAGMNLRRVSLQEALQLAAKQGPDVAAARAQAAIAHAQVDRAWTAWQPDAVVNGQYDHTNGVAAVDFRPLLAPLGLPLNSFGPQPLTIVAQNNWNGFAQITQPIFTPQGAFGIGAARSGAEAADRGADQAREQILLSVARAYLGLQGLEGLLQAARDAEKVALRREDDAKARINAGTDVEIGLLRAQSETAGARVQIANIVGQQQNLLPLLEALTGENIAPVVFGQAPGLPLPPESSTEPWEDSYSVRSALLQVSAQAQSKRVSEFGWLPSVSAVAKESYTSNEGFVGKNWTYDLMINASLPVWDRGVRLAQLHEDDARLQQAQANLASARARAKADWVGSKANLIAAQAVLDQTISQEQVATRAQVQVEASARAGVATSLDLSDADQRKFAAQSAAAQARTALEVRKAEIAASVGRLYSLTADVH
jgi:outer membrane protein